MRPPRHLEPDGAPGDEPAFSGLRGPAGNAAAVAGYLAAHLGIDRLGDAAETARLPTRRRSMPDSAAIVLINGTPMAGYFPRRQPGTR